MSYPSEMIFNDTNNNKIVKAENLFSFNLSEQDNFFNKSYSDNQILLWIMSHAPFERKVVQEAKVTPRKMKEMIVDKITGKKLKRKQKHSGKMKKWVLKLLKRLKKKERKKYGIKSKYIIPLILGLLVVKSLFILIALKALAFISTKGLMMGFFSTALASILSLRGMFEHSHSYQNHIKDPKTKVEIIHVPSKNDEHIYYEDYYRRKDNMRMLT